MGKEKLGRIRAARLDTSGRLQSVFWLMADGEEHSTREISRTCDRYAINSIMAELRNKEVGNELTIPRAKSHDGAYWYRMALDERFRYWRRVLQEQAEVARRAG
jgi:hypothetical protein